MLAIQQGVIDGAENNEISGSGTAAASAMGAIIGPIEEEQGYDRDFSAAANIATAPIAEELLLRLFLWPAISFCSL